MRKLDGSNDKRTFRMSIFASFLRGAYKLSGAKKGVRLAGGSNTQCSNRSADGSLQ